MSNIFDKIDYELGQRLIASTQDKVYLVSKDFYAGDHWNPGGISGWVGPKPPIDDPSYSDIMAVIKESFVSRNIIKEVVDRHVANALAAEPYWKFSPRRELGFGEKPTADEENRMVEAEALLQAWINDRIVSHDNDDENDMFRHALATLLLGGRSVLRLFVPPDELVNGQVPTGTLEESIERVFVHHVGREDATVYLDPSSQRRVGLWRYDFEDVLGEEYRGIEMTYLDRQKRTIIRKASLTGGNPGVIGGYGFVESVDDESPVTLDLGGRLTMFEMRRPPLIGTEVHSLQKLHNMNWTMWGRNVVLAGFLERVVLNAHLPKGLKVGAGTTYSLIGKEIVDQDGRRTIATPSVLWRDPVDVTSFRTTREASYHAILEQVNMAHYTLTGDSRLSAESRRQSLADYSKDLRVTANAAERGFRWLLETVLKMAATFSGEPNRFDDLRAQVAISANPSITDPDVWLAIDQLVQSRMMSRETGMSEMGISDIDSELNRIASERGSGLWDQLGVPQEPPAGVSGGSGSGAGVEGGAKPIVVKSFVRRPRGVASGA